MARNPPATNTQPDTSSSACRSRQVSRTLALSRHTRPSPAVCTPSMAERLASGLRQLSCQEADADPPQRSPRMATLRAVDRAPDPLGGGRHIDMRDAERRQRIKDRVDYRLRRGHAAGLACALDAERVYGCRQVGE